MDSEDLMTEDASSSWWKGKCLSGAQLMSDLIGRMSMSSPLDIVIRSAVAEDIPAILGFVKELAEYEHLSHMVTATEADLREALFGERPYAEAIVATWRGEAAGFGLFFHNYSTFLARPGIYIEDVYVRPSHRGRGLGKALLARIAAIAVARRCARIEWSVLKWNEPSIRFYRSLGAAPLEEWQMFRMTGEAISRLAAGNT